MRHGLHLKGLAGLRPGSFSTGQVRRDDRVTTHWTYWLKVRRLTNCCQGHCTLTWDTLFCKVAVTKGPGASLYFFSTLLFSSPWCDVHHCTQFLSVKSNSRGKIKTYCYHGLLSHNCLQTIPLCWTDFTLTEEVIKVNGAIEPWPFPPSGLSHPLKVNNVNIFKFAGQSSLRWMDLLTPFLNAF